MYHRNMFIFLLFQILHQTVCTSRGLTDTQSVSTPRPTAVKHACATTAQSTVSTSPAPSLRALTPSCKSVAGRAKVQVQTALAPPPKRQSNVDALKSSLAGCSHEGRERANGERWDDTSDPCVECVCREGSVQCERKRCPPSNCEHPVQRQCCMSCDGEQNLTNSYFSLNKIQYLNKMNCNSFGKE